MSPPVLLLRKLQGLGVGVGRQIDKRHLFFSPGTPGREQNFENKANNLANFSNRAAKTALMVAAGSSGGNKKLTEALLASAGQVYNVYSYSSL